MLRFLLLGLIVAVFVSLPSIRTDDALTDQEILEADERPLAGQLKDREVQTTGNSEIDCDGNQECRECFAECDGDEKCAMDCVLHIGLDSDDKQGSERMRFGRFRNRPVLQAVPGGWRRSYRHKP
ncbi:uncharacterized protein LOC128241894 [Mya arenaria]|uniref:uncharacterized protein LOC128239898 n=1 Tax=Mya arenaria TaxID=6604 RepID=UPI0022E4255D|nr:uncharacterized protein LOC128239898 [Mya arenaria]XP_052814975.1 uncharacterized protein LOC128241894 [Mya arenaria]